MSSEMFDKYIKTMYYEKEKLDDFWEQYKILKEDAQNKSLISLPNRKLFASILFLHGSYFGEHNEIKGIDFSYIDLSYADLSNLIFIDCNFNSASLYRSNLDSAIFENCKLINANLKSAILASSEFYNSRLNNSNFDDADMLDVYFNNCDLTNISVKGTNLLNIEAKNTIVQEIKIDRNTSILNGTFENVDWSRVDVSNINISIDQTKYFLNCSKGLSSVQVYNPEYKRSGIEELQDHIFKNLCNSENIIPSSNSVSDLDIFISYAREMEDHVSSLSGILKDKYEIWWDHQIKDSDMLSEQIKLAIYSCKVAVVIFSQEYMIKGWPRYEFYELLKKASNSNFILLIVIDNVINNSPIDLSTVKDELKGENLDNIIFIDSIKDVYDQISNSYKV